MEEIENKIYEFAKENNLIISDDTKIIFFNHLNEFLKRVNSDNQIYEKIDKDLLNQISDSDYDLSRKLAILICQKEENKISNFEIFLISTHISIMEKK